MVDFTQWISSNLGIAQRSLLSPFLFNIYFTELDKFVEKLKTKIFLFTEYKGQKKVLFYKKLLMNFVVCKKSFLVMRILVQF